MNSLLCEYTEESMSKKYGRITLPLHKALQLETEGKVKIINKNDNILKVISDYNKKTNDTVLKNRIDSKKKVAWVQDNSKTGGAEISNAYLRELGNQLGFYIELITPQKFDYSFLLTCDIVIINNFYEFENEQYQKIYKVIYELRKPYIKYDHDHREVKRPHLSRQLFTLSKKNIFFSPAHEKLFYSSLGEHIKQHSIRLPVAIDINKYVNKNLQREKDSVLVPCLRKCLNNFKFYYEQNKNKKYTVILDGISNIYRGEKEIKYLTRVNQDMMIDLYNAHEIVYHCPDTFWAGERVIFESVLCGCQYISNDNAGHTSWNFNTDSIKVILSKANYDFWKVVEKCL